MAARRTSPRFSPRRLPPLTPRSAVAESPKTGRKKPEKGRRYPGQTAAEVAQLEAEREAAERELENVPEEKLSEEEKDILRERGKYGPVSHLSLKAALPSHVRCLLYKQLDYPALEEMAEHHLFAEVQDCVEEIVLPEGTVADLNFLSEFHKLARISGEIKTSKDKKHIYHSFGKIQARQSEDAGDVDLIRDLVNRGIIFDHVHFKIINDEFETPRQIREWLEKDVPKLARDPRQNFTFRVEGPGEKNIPGEEIGFYDGGFLLYFRPFSDAPLPLGPREAKKVLHERSKDVPQRYWLGLEIARDLSLEEKDGDDEIFDKILGALGDLRLQIETLEAEKIPFSGLSVSKSVRGALGDEFSFRNIIKNWGREDTYPISLEV